MGRPRRVLPTSPPRMSPDLTNGLQTRFELFTYALSRLPPRQIPFLALYAYIVLYASQRGWISREATGKGGAAVVGVLSMVSGLLMSYRFSSAVSKWDEGKKVWVETRTAIREGMRMLSVSSVNPPATSSPSITSSTPIDLGDISPNEDEKTHTGAVSAGTPARRSSSSESTPDKEKAKARDTIAERTDELTALFVSFAFALQHHLQGSRPLPQPPLCDLLPPAYLSSLKRTEARVRFADDLAGPSGLSSWSNLSANSVMNDEGYRPGFRRRGTGPPTTEERSAAGKEEEWELGSLRYKAEEAVAMFAEAVAGTGDEGADVELRQQLSQLNLPNQSAPRVEVSRPKSNLHSPHPPNLPLALLKLMDGYIMGLAEAPIERGGWTDAKRERALGVVKSLGTHLGEAERLSANPPPLPLTLHLSHLLLIYLAALPCSLLCVVSGWSVILITVIAGWCLLGLEALIAEVAGVFGISENHHPLPRLTKEVLQESLDISPAFMRYYRARLVSRLGEEDAEVTELDRRCRRSAEEWMPSFR